jgi:O-antigen ligase
MAQDAVAAMRGGIMDVRGESPPGSWLRMLRRLPVLLGVLYAIAICFERAIPIEVLKPYRLIGGAIVLLMLVRGRVRLDRLAKLSIAFVLAGFLLAVAQTMLASENFIPLLRAVALWSFNLATFIALASLLKDRREIILIGIVHALAMLIAAYVISSEAAVLAHEDPGGLMRLTGDFKNPANACISMLFSCTVLLTFLRRRVRVRGPLVRMLKILAILAIPLYFLYTSSLTGSRAGSGLLLVGLATYCALTSLRQVAIALGFVAILLAVAYAIAPQNLDLSERSVLAMRVEKKGMDTDRLYVWRAGFDAYVDTYGIGLGMSRYQHVHRKYFAKYAMQSDPRLEDFDLSLHNDYVSALVEFGTIGFVIFVFLFRRLLIMARGIRDRDARAIAVSLLVGLAINGMAHTGLAYFAVWFYFALLSAWVRLAKTAPAVDRPLVPWRPR